MKRTGNHRNAMLTPDESGFSFPWPKIRVRLNLRRALPGGMNSALQFLARAA